MSPHDLARLLRPLSAPLFAICFFGLLSCAHERLPRAGVDDTEKPVAEQRVRFEGIYAYGDFPAELRRRCLRYSAPDPNVAQICCVKGIVRWYAAFLKEIEAAGLAEAKSTRTESLDCP
jgi:hypothetical protein